MKRARFSEKQIIGISKEAETDSSWLLLPGDRTPGLPLKGRSARREGYERLEGR